MKSPDNTKVMDLAKAVESTHSTEDPIIPKFLDEALEVLGQIFPIYRADIQAIGTTPLTPEHLLLLARAVTEHPELASAMTYLDLQGPGSRVCGRRADSSFSAWRKPSSRAVDATIATLTRLLTLSSQNEVRKILLQPGGHAAAPLLLAVLASSVKVACLPHRFNWPAISGRFYTPITFPQLTSLTWDIGSKSTGISDFNLHLGLRSILTSCTALVILILTHHHNRRLDTLDFLDPVSHTLRKLCIICTATSHLQCRHLDDPSIPLASPTCAQSLRNLPNLSCLTVSQCYARHHDHAHPDTRHRWLGDLVAEARFAAQLKVVHITDVRSTSARDLDYMAESLTSTHPCAFPRLRRVQLTSLPGQVHWKWLRSQKHGPHHKRLAKAGIDFIVRQDSADGYFPEGEETETKISR